jgi:hypothetical protein
VDTIEKDLLSLIEPYQPDLLIEMYRVELSFGWEFRKELLEAALLVEGITSALLKQLLGIQNQESKVFGRSGAAMPFSMKIELLMEVGMLEEAMRNKMKLFMELRNQAAHVHDLPTITSLLEGLGRKPNYLLNHYGSFNETEGELRRVLTLLCSEVIQTVFSVSAKVLRAKIEVNVGRMGRTWMSQRGEVMHQVRKDLQQEIISRDGMGTPWTLKEILAIPQDYERRVNTRFLETMIPGSRLGNPTGSDGE